MNSGQESGAIPNQTYTVRGVETVDRPQSVVVYRGSFQTSVLGLGVFSVSLTLAIANSSGKEGDGNSREDSVTGFLFVKAIEKLRQ